MKYKQYLHLETLLRQNTKKLFSLMLRQCPPAMKSKIESQDDWKTMKSGYVVIDLMNALRDVTYKFEGNKNTYVSLHSAQRDTFLIRQGEQEYIISYKERHYSVIGVVEGISGGSLWETTVAIEHDLKALNYTLGFETILSDDNEASKLILQTALATAKEKALAIGFLIGSAKNRYQPLLDGLENQFTLEVNNYPTCEWRRTMSLSTIRRTRQW